MKQLFFALLAVFLCVEGESQTITLNDDICFVSNVFTKSGTVNGRSRFVWDINRIEWSGTRWEIWQNSILLYHNVANTMEPPCSAPFPWWDHNGCDLLGPLSVTGACDNTVLASNVHQLEGNVIGRKIELFWEFSNENVISEYEIQHYNENEEWEVLASMSISDDVNHFSHEDVLIGVHYYRVMTKSEGGNINYSNTVGLVLQFAPGELHVSNPVDDGFVKISYVSDLNTHMDCQIYGMNGGIINFQKFPIEVGENSLKMDISQLLPGQYFLKGLIDGAVIVKPLIVLR